MSKEERIAIQNVVGGTQPKLIHLAPEESDEEADEPEVVEEEEEGEKLVSIKLLEPETTLCQVQPKLHTDRSGIFLPD